MKNQMFVICLILCTALSILSGCQTGAFQIQVIPKNQELTETRLTKDRGLFVTDKIVVIDVDGVMMNRPQSALLRQGDNPVSTFVEKLDKAAADENVKAVVLRLNSPGGSVAAADIMYHCLSEFKRKTQKPVIACMLDVAASGAYYLACGCDGIIAQPTTVTGSIGTILQTFSVAGTMDKIGVKTVAVKSGKMKDIASPLHDLSEEEQNILQQIIDKFYEQFLAVVENGRPGLDKEKLQKLADGRVFTADQAKTEELIDRIGYMNDAVKWAKDLAGVDKAQTVIYHRPQEVKRNVYGSAMASGGLTPLVNIDLPDWLESSGTQFLYLWQPGL
jgi:protease-4